MTCGEATVVYNTTKHIGTNDASSNVVSTSKLHAILTVLYNIKHCTQYSVSNISCYFEWRSLYALRENVPKRLGGLFRVLYTKNSFPTKQRLDCLLIALYILWPHIRAITYPI